MGMSFSFNGRNYIENVYTNGSTLVNYSYLAYGTKLSTLDYSATSAHWLSMDPLAEKYCSVSPYAFCSNNPINRYDPNGKWDIKVSAMDDRASAPYAIMTVTNRSGETIYKLL